MISTALLAGASPQGVAATNVLGEGSALESGSTGARGVSASIRMGKIGGLGFFGDRLSSWWVAGSGALGGDFRTDGLYRGDHGFHAFRVLRRDVLFFGDVGGEMVEFEVVEGGCGEKFPGAVAEGE